VKKILNLLLFVLVILGVACAPSPKKIATNAIESNQQDPFISYQKGIMMLKKGEYTMAINFFQQAIDGDPKNANYWNMLGLALGPIGELEEAVNAFKKSLELAPEITDVHNNLGTVYIELGEYDKAMKEFGTVLKDKTYPTPYFAYFNIGLLKKKLDKTDEAIYAFEQAIKLKPDFIRVYLELAPLYYKKKMYQECLSVINKTKKTYSNEPLMLILEAECLYELGNLKEAKRALTKLSILFPPEDIAKQADELKKKITRKEWSTR
jgi:superkiller protein 3